MIAILSPAKKLDFTSPIDSNLAFTKPVHLKEAEELIAVLKLKSAKEIGELMKLSPALSDLNYNRYKTWTRSHTLTNARQNVLSFNGAAYLGLDAPSLSEKDLLYSQDHLRILSGLYGILKPLDLLKEYRLEMGTRLKTEKGTNLYQFWGDKVTKALKKDLKKQGNILVNLASNEYSKVLDLKALDTRVITCHFKDMSKSGEYKTIMTFAKSARGLMTRYILKNKITSPDDLIGFDYKGYFYNEAYSSENELTFLRG
jgi:cytoplasmic iron level regulating protein YaaA (DUF328/UPF0246 family)